MFCDDASKSRASQGVRYALALAVSLCAGSNWAQVAGAAQPASALPAELETRSSEPLLISAPLLADYLPKPKATAGRIACSTEALRTSADLGTITVDSQPLLGLLRQWGLRNLPFAGLPRGCVDWSALVRAWQQTTQAPVTGVLSAADLNSLNDARMAHFSAYRTALAAWQQERAEAVLNAKAPLPSPPAELLTPDRPDSLAELGDAPERVTRTADPLLSIECVFGEGLAGARFCKAAAESGRLKGRDLQSVHSSLSAHYRDVGDLRRAMLHATRAVEAHASAYHLAWRANIYLLMKEFGRALVDADAALAVPKASDWERSRAYAMRAAIVGMSGNTRGAWQDNEESLRLDPKNEQALKNRRVIQQRL